MTIRMTESEYLARPADYRGVWTTERTDWPDWEQVKDQYMGKRTLMICEKGGVALVMEGAGLEIVPDDPKVPAGYTAEELDRDNPFNQWMQE